MREQLVTVEIEEAATRPPMFMGLIPAKIAGLLFLIGTLALILTDPYRWEAAELVAIAMIFFGIKPLVARDYHGFDNFTVWVRLDFLCLDTHHWGGTRLSTFPKWPERQYGMASDVI